MRRGGGGARGTGDVEAMAKTVAEGGKRANKKIRTTAVASPILMAGTVRCFLSPSPCVVFVRKSFLFAALREPTTKKQKTKNTKSHRREKNSSYDCCCYLLNNYVYIGSQKLITKGNIMNYA